MCRQDVGAVAVMLWVGWTAAGCKSKGSSPDSGVDLGVSTDLSVPPTPVPFGLDSRPANPTCVAPNPPPSDTTVMTAVAFPSLPGFNPVTGMFQPPGDSSRFIVVEQGGAIKAFANSPTVSTVTPFATVPSASLKIGSAGEGGLLGLTFHPNWATNHAAYLSYTAPGGGSNNMHSVLSRVTSSDGNATLDLSTEQVILTLNQPYDNHNGGTIGFGNDGLFYIGFGDGGSADDPNGNGQNLNTWLGKMLRIDVDGAAPYAIPPSNPFAQGGGLPEIYAYGLRNPWKWSFDRPTGDLWVGDVGQNLYEEVDKIEMKGNYGWSVREGMHCHPAGTSCSSAGMIDPIVEYPHLDSSMQATGDTAIIGGHVYRGTAIPSLVGTYLFSDYGSGHLYGIAYDPTTGAASVKLLAKTGVNISSLAQGADGEEYVIPYNSAILKIVPAGAPQADTFPKLLSATGCVDPNDPTKPAAGLIPYGVNSPLWSDGAEKQRYLALPDGQKIHIGADGDWDLPIGSVLMKTFSLGGVRVETRLLMHHPDGSWAGYSYEWNDAQTDAALLPAGKSKLVGAQSWTYPSRTECLSCHTIAAGRTLGLETGQQDGDFVYPGNLSANQLATLDHIGLFDAPLPPVATLVRYPSPSSTSDPLEPRARSYLHSNCSFCHRPMGTGQGPADFRFSTPLSMANVCNVMPMAGTLGVAGGLLVAPGHPEKSIISYRMHALDVDRMPPLATHVVDTAGAKVIDDWISSLSSCP